MEILSIFVRTRSKDRDSNLPSRKDEHKAQKTDFSSLSVNLVKQSPSWENKISSDNRGVTPFSGTPRSIALNITCH